VFNAWREYADLFRDAGRLFARHVRVEDRELKAIAEM
jgi:hypothetical protein